MAEKARTKTLSPDEMAGGTFTITNPGVFGALIGTPIIPEGQVAILDVEAIVKRPMVVTDEHGNDAIAIRLMMFLCLSLRPPAGRRRLRCPVHGADQAEPRDAGTRRHSACEPMAVPREPRASTPYAEALAEMTELAAARTQGAVPDTVMLLEHEPVITLGSRADRAAELPLADERVRAPRHRDRRGAARGPVDVPRPRSAGVLPDPRADLARPRPARLRAQRWSRC